MQKIDELYSQSVEILKLISDDDVMSIADSIILISEFLAISPDELDPVRYANMKLEVAQVVSQFSDMFSEQLSTISKLHPKFYEKVVEYNATKSNE